MWVSVWPQLRVKNKNTFTESANAKAPKQAVVLRQKKCNQIYLQSQSQHRTNCTWVNHFVKTIARNRRGDTGPVPMCLCEGMGHSLSTDMEPLDQMTALHNIDTFTA